MVVLGEEDPKLLKCIPIDGTSFVSYAPYQNLLISRTSSLSFFISSSCCGHDKQGVYFTIYKPFSGAPTSYKVSLQSFGRLMITAC